MLVCVVISYYGGADVLDALNKMEIPSVRVQLQEDDQNNKFIINYLNTDFKEATYVIHHDGVLENLANELRKLGVTHIIPSDEAGVSLTDELCHLLGLEFNGMDLSLARRNKVLMHKELSRHNVKIPLQDEISSLSEVEEWMSNNNISFPVVVKPVDGAGSSGVTKCFNPEGVSGAIGNIKNLSDHTASIVSIADRFIAQEVLQGSEYVVNTVSSNKIHKLTDVWKCYKGSHNGASFVYEYFDLIDDQDQVVDILYQYSCRVLNALQIEMGPGHAEIYVSDDNVPTIVEIGARLGGPKMCFGVQNCVADRKSQLEYTMDAYLTPPKQEEIKDWQIKYQKIKNSRMVFLISYKTGEFLEWDPEMLKKIMSLPSYIHAEYVVFKGDQLQKTIDVRSSPGFIYLQHDSHDQIEKDYQMIRNLENDLYRVIVPAILLEDHFQSNPNKV